MKYTILHTWSGDFEYNYFPEIFKFRDFMQSLRNFVKSVFAHIFAKFDYFVKVIIYSKSPDHVLQNDI